MSKVSLDRIFTYHAPFGDQKDRYQRIRDAGKALAAVITECSPPSREQSLALTSVQQAVQWANSAIAINEIEPVTAPADLQEVS